MRIYAGRFPCFNRQTETGVLRRFQAQLRVTLTPDQDNACVGSFGLLYFSDGLRLYQAV